MHLAKKQAALLSSISSAPLYLHMQNAGILMTQLISFGMSLRERLLNHKAFTKDQCFYLDHHKFSIKSCFGCVLESPR